MLITLDGQDTEELLKCHAYLHGRSAIPTTICAVVATHGAPSGPPEGPEISQLAHERVGRLRADRVGCKSQVSVTWARLIHWTSRSTQ
jgi:hypothetical protein